jgi:hypothetical protein
VHTGQRNFRSLSLRTVQNVYRALGGTPSARNSSLTLFCDFAPGCEGRVNETHPSKVSS